MICRSKMHFAILNTKEAALIVFFTRTNVSFEEKQCNAPGKVDSMTSLFIKRRTHVLSFIFTTELFITQLDCCVWVGFAPPRLRWGLTYKCWLKRFKNNKIDWRFLHDMTRLTFLLIGSYLFKNFVMSNCPVIPCEPSRVFSWRFII